MKNRKAPTPPPPRSHDLFRDLDDAERQLVFDKAAGALANAAVEILMRRAAEAGRAVAPWPDFKGNPIRDGDTIRHPDDLEGRVMYNTTFGHYGHVGAVSPEDRWLVDYGDSQPLSRLCLQIDDKGQGVVVGHD